MSEYESLLPPKRQQAKGMLLTLLQKLYHNLLLYIILHKLLEFA